jgi:biopolymer transport protein ExbD
MTAVIDIVFLLIIFFLVVSQFIDTEDFPVTVPDGCEFALDERSDLQTATLTVVGTDEQRTTFAVGAKEITPRNNDELPGIVDRLVELIDMSLANLPQESRIVTLRIDKDIPYSQAQYALAAVARSTATDIRLAALSEKLESD